MTLTNDIYGYRLEIQAADSDVIPFAPLLLQHVKYFLIWLNWLTDFKNID
jgi:hypothetical protein